ncbi:Low affinity iron permease [Thozetella sp. PMI_491]|nr:Low affinity iron permease [Thozetella sp. PMI_491]
MRNPISFVLIGVKDYVKRLKDAPAAQYMTRAAAPSMNPSLTSLPPPAYVPESEYIDQNNGAALHSSEQQLPKRPAGKPKKKGGVFDFVVKLAGSRWTFLGSLSLLALWAVLGIVNGPSDTWQVLLQDVSSIQCYISATLLMRQQQNATRSLLDEICSMISRSLSNERMLRQLTPKQLRKLQRSMHSARQDILSSLQMKESVFDKMANAVSRALGSLWATGIYWVGIGTWAVWGIPLEFSNTWQLYVNTATAIELTFTTMFLQSVRRQHEEYLEKCLKSIDIVDREMEMDLRRMTGDLLPNPVVESVPPKLTRIEKAIDVYAFVIGGSIGVFISVAVAIAWAGVGHSLDFDDNWWLIIGTYTGLVGFMDGFILRNVHHRETLMADRHFEQLLEQDFKLFHLLGMPLPEEEPAARRSISVRISAFIAHLVEVSYASVAAVLIVVILLAIASAMQWTETGQLLCNTPTMIVEGFLLLMLIQGHNGAEHKRRIQWSDVLNRRLALDRRVSAWDDPDYVLKFEMEEEKNMGFDEKYMSVEAREVYPDEKKGGVF